MLFAVGSMAHTMALSDKLPSLTDGLCDTSDAESIVRRIVPFVAGGMRATGPPAGGEQR
jgi:hypothetical protein